MNKFAKYVAKDVRKSSGRDLQLDEVKAGRRRGLLRRLFEDQWTDKVDRYFIVRATVRGCPVEVSLPANPSGVMFPYVLCVELPAPVAGAIECRRGVFGRKWESKTRQKKLVSRLKRLLPKVQMQHSWVAVNFTVDVCYTLEPLSESSTLWTVHSAYESKFLGGYKPRVGKFLKVIPDLVRVLDKHGARR